MRTSSIARMLASSLLLLACECGGGNGLPSALARYGEAYEVTPVDSWTSPGLRFYRVVEVGVQDRSSTSIVAIDERGALLEGAELFARFRSLPAQELAEHACFTLIDGCTPLSAADPSAAMWLDGDASRVEAPHLADDHLVFDIVQGDMAPRALRVTVDVAAGTILSRDPLREPAAPSPPAPSPAAIPASIQVTMGAPIAGPPRFVTATFESGSPSTVHGCVSSVAGACFASVLVTLDTDASSELARLLADVLAIPRCEPEGIFPGDLDYELSWPGAPRAYLGHVPSDESQTAARSSGPCRADARLARWIARWVLAESRAASDYPDPLVVTLDTSSGSTPRFVNATVHLAPGPLAIVGCTASAAGTCHATTRIELDDVQAARLRALIEDVRGEPCHVPFPAGAALSLEMGLAYDGRCAADASLAWWVGRTLDAVAMGGT